MYRCAVILCFLAVSCVLGVAGGTTNEVVDASPAAAQASPTQRGEQGERDPFWPIGYVPPSKPGGSVGPAKTNATEFVKETPSQGSGLSGMLKIGGVIRKSGKFYATINGFTVQTGEVVTAVVNDEVYKFVVEKIDFKKVQIRPVRQ